MIPILRSWKTPALRHPGCPSILTTVEHPQLAAGRLDDHLGRLPVLSLLVRPLPRLKLALDLDLCSLLQVDLNDGYEMFVPDDDTVLFRLFLALAGRLVLPTLGRSDREIADDAAVLH